MTFCLDLNQGMMVQGCGNRTEQKGTKLQLLVQWIQGRWSHGRLSREDTFFGLVIAARAECPRGKGDACSLD